MMLGLNWLKDLLVLVYAITYCTSDIFDVLTSTKILKQYSKSAISEITFF